MRIRIVSLALVLCVAAAASASADTPVSAMGAALQKTASARTAHVKLVQHFTAPDRTTDSTVAGTLARGDQDLTTTGDGGESRRVAVGQSVYQRRPNSGDAPWKTSSRSAPATDQAFGSLTLPDGTSLADQRLYRNVQDVGTEQLPQGLARKITADVDMTAVAVALKLPAAEQSQLGQMQGRVTLWISTADGNLLRHNLVITIPGAGGARTIDTTIDLSDLDAALTVTAP
jgi:protein-disulfide isomerase